MKYIIGARRSGKSTALLKWLSEGEETGSWPFWSRVLLAVNEQQASHLRYAYRDLIGKSIFPDAITSFESWLKHSRGMRKMPEVAVDEASHVLQQMLGPIAIISLDMDEGVQVLQRQEA